MTQTEILQLSVGVDIPDHRFADGAYSGSVDLVGKPVKVDITGSAMRALSDARAPVLVELELYFSCLVRKQVRFSELLNAESGLRADAYTPVLPGLFAAFRAVTTKECKVADVDGKPPVETMPVKKPGLFVPDWLKLDFRAGKWLGEYGFERRLQSHAV